MLSLDLGPLALGVPQAILLGSLLLAVAVGWWLGRAQGVNPEGRLFALLVVAVVIARLVFILAYAEEYESAPWQVLDIRDGGFVPWPGILAALVLAGWWLWRRPRLRRPLGAGLTIGLAAWVGASYLWHMSESDSRLPALVLHDAQGAPVELEDHLGKPLVINLWATWCPPCRREMPVLAEFQRRAPEVTFLFVNEGERPQTVRAYLAKEDLALDNLLLDADSQLGQAVGSHALPTTLFYDADGRRLGVHLGEFSRASLAATLLSLDMLERLPTGDAAFVDRP
ncbi:TlpA family protein disulfide reductase [Stutzerimonas urumqiensis]|uniref:prolipoprotein diacylglyceryl transferase family protein n=1 Tax=Stutzerimonas urumqiensis TaxID=638269 RepID=UPI003BA92B13